MRIQALEVEGIGRFAGIARVDGFGPGVNVLAAGNEVGKSTLFRAVRTCLFCRHDSKASEIRDLAADECQLPASVQLTFERNGHSYVIKKSFVRSPSATLTQDGVELARGKQADEAIWDLLGVQPGSGRSVEDGAFGLLWVAQGASFTAPAPCAGATSVLNAAIEAEVGTLVGGERARQTLARIQAELGRSLTETERPRSDGPLARALREVEHWTAAERDAQGKLDLLEQQLSELRQLRRQLAELTDPAFTARMQQELVEAKMSLDDALSAAKEIRRLEAEESAARRATEGAAQRLKQHRDLCARIDANRHVEATLARELPAQNAQEHELRGALARSETRIVKIEQGQQGLVVRAHALEMLAAALLRAERKEELARQLDTLEQAAADLRETDAELAQLAVKPKAVDALDALERRIAALDAQAAAAAAHLAVEVLPAGAGAVRIGADRLGGPHAAPVLAPTEIRVGELAIIRVTPAAHPTRDERQSLEADRAALLRSIGVASAAQAHARLSRRRDLEAMRKGILAQLKALNVDGDPALAIDRLKSALAEADASIAAALATSARNALPPRQEVEAEKLALAQERVSLDGERAKHEETRHLTRAALDTALALRSGTESKLDVVRANIVADAALCADADRGAREAALVTDLAHAEAAHQTAHATLTTARQVLPEAPEIERRQARCQRLEQALNNQNNERLRLEREVGRLTGQIQTAGGDGVGEALAAAQEQRALAERERERVQERIATLQLLRDTISASLTQGRHRYYEPVRRHLRPFLNDLFPGAELELGEGFSIDAIRRGRSEAFRRLSDGTQEQIAVLVRLAMGAMLAERGQAVPVILDDALVYSDDDRIQRMFDALSRAGKHQQIIVLTCRLRAFAPLGGHALSVRVGATGDSSLAA